MKHEQRKWTVRTIDKKNVKFFPVFEVNEAVKNSLEAPSVADKEVECRYVDVEVPDKKGNYQTLRFNYLDLYMFMYFTANEELRQALQQRYERNINYIPYEVSFKLDEREQREGFAKRRIELPIDDISMAIARNESFKLMGKSYLFNPKS